MCAIKLSENEVLIIVGYDFDIDFVWKFGEGQKKVVKI